ncbi:hypothetical protein BOW30_11470 [Solemya velum gill symbiont]|uniref:hypothetical protein n=1 Tax=Solemya velum gill symbiont TaxID=2340 RepID=UPI000998D554|nr:hypothetical protein [Solemya velum gill symbiont]OOZ21026.1 hypothetical protein BOW30_11470 [Solemya velum gill symbiont]
MIKILIKSASAILTRTAMLSIVLVLLLLSNILSLTNYSFHAALYGLLETIPYTKTLKDTPTSRYRKVIKDNDILVDDNYTLAKTTRSFEKQAEFERRQNKILDGKYKSLVKDNEKIIESKRVQTERIEHTANKIAKRTARNAALNVSSVPFEVIPWIGIATIATDLGLATNNDDKKTVCGYTVPTVGELQKTAIEKKDEYIDILKDILTW